ncbi:MAG: hypothetical protein A2W09_01100 [Deltaproteobacteria bacterium RBG_16_50_11]|nr:MAG: hypothetical protein A2W09_01100 [Deltaproteobacteria bacterium RBG_16_50_11]
MKIHSRPGGVNHKLIYRLYTEEGLAGRTKKRRKLVSALRVVRPGASARTSGGSWILSPIAWRKYKPGRV